VAILLVGIAAVLLLRLKWSLLLVLPLVALIALGLGFAMGGL
jgi:hypothetical protein